MKELEARAEIQSICCITAQHRQMLDDVLELFQITPTMTWTSWRTARPCPPSPANACWGWRGCFQEESPTWCWSTATPPPPSPGALAAFYQKIPVGHVEAGLRTWDKYSPFPEEMNRTLVGDLAQFHFAPPRPTGKTCWERGSQRGIFVTGNTVIDALKTTVRPDYSFRTQLLNTLDYAGKRVILVTCHRRENYGQPMENVMKALRRIAEDFPERPSWSTPSTSLRWSRRWPGSTCPAMTGFT